MFFFFRDGYIDGSTFYLEKTLHCCFMFMFLFLTFVRKGDVTFFLKKTLLKGTQGNTFCRMTRRIWKNSSPTIASRPGGFTYFLILHPGPETVFFFHFHELVFFLGCFSRLFLGTYLFHHFLGGRKSSPSDSVGRSGGFPPCHFHWAFRTWGFLWIGCH